MRNTNISDEGRNILKSVIGSTYQNLSGWHLDQILCGDDVIIATSRGNMLLHANSIDFEIEGEWDEFAFTEVSIATQAQVERASKSGNIYKQLAGQRVIDVAVVSYSISCFSRKLPHWRYETDTSITLITQSGYVSVGRSSFHTDMMDIHFGEEFDVEKLDPVWGYYEDSPEATYEIVRQVEFLGGSKLESRHVQR
jgi:hypothetical protein